MILSYKGVGDPVLEVCSKKYLSYTVVGKAKMVVWCKLNPLIYCPGRGCFRSIRHKNTFHILSWERPKKGYPPEKRSPVQSVEDVRFVQVAQKWVFRKRGLKVAKLAVLGGVFRYNQRIIT